MTTPTTGLYAQSKPLSQSISLDGRTFSGLTPECCLIPEWLPIDSWGYRTVSNGKGSKSRAHRISYRLFVGPIPPGTLVLHRCGDASCINPFHLYLGDSLQNARDRYLHGTAYIAHLLPQTKLSADQVRDIRASKKRNVDLAREYGVWKGTISNIKCGRSRANVMEG